MITPSSISLWTDLGKRADLLLSEDQISRFGKYLELLFIANQTMNLTRITDPASAEVLHVGDALTLLPFLPKKSHRLADVGSGGGVPGMVLAIARPDVSIVLIESTKKKTQFLQSVAGELGLANVTVDPRRVEDVGKSNLRESFDVVVARAVATMDWLSEWMLPLARKGGTILAMKGSKAEEELASCRRTIKILGGAPARIEPVDLPGTDHHTIIRIPKILPTDARYPRLPSFAKGRSLSG